VSDPSDKPGSAAPIPPGGAPRATTTQPLAPVDPAEVEDGAFETTGSFRTEPAGVPVIDAPFPPAPRPAAPSPAPGPTSPATARARPAPQGSPGASPTPRPAAPGTPGIPTPRPAAQSTRPPTAGAGAPARSPTAASPPAAPRPMAGAAPSSGAPRPPTREQPAASAPRAAPLGSPTGEFLTEQARAAGPPPQPGVVPARVFRAAPKVPASPPLPSLGVRIAPVIPPLAPVKESPARSQPATQAPRVPRRSVRDPMSETSLGIPVMPPLPPVEAGPLPPLDVQVAPLVSPVSPAPAPPADPDAQLAWRAERLDTLDYFELLGVPTTASAVEVKRAFYRESRAYHPDRFFHLADPVFKTKVHEVYKRVTEAYYVLRDDVRRRKYLADVTGPDRARKLRFDELAEQETKAAVKQQAAEQIGINPRARQLFQTAMTELEKGNLAGAERDLKMALTYERENALYKEKLTLVQDQLHEQFRREGKAFKIT